MTTATGDTLNYTYDALKRLNKVTTKNASGTALFSTSYAFRNLSTTSGITQTTTQVQYRNVRIGINGTILEGKKYSYDDVGNITKISQSTSPYNPLVAYEYDSQNQLISEIYYDGEGSADTNITQAYYYTYDTAGNLLTVEEGTVNSDGTITKTTIQTYTYGTGDWKDLLTAVNGNTIIYEGQTYNESKGEIEGAATGNPTSYPVNGTSYDLTWQNGRQLAAAEASTGTTDTALSYAYDTDGIRTSKTYTVSTYEDIPQYTVIFVADGVTVKTMTVNDGYTLQSSDYPTVPAKTGYTGNWQQYTTAIHSNITIQAIYTINQYTVTFVADGVTVKTMTVNDGYTLQDSDYPAVPAKAGYTGAWGEYTSAVHSDLTIQAIYTTAPTYTVTFVADGVTVKTMTVNDGYTLQSSDYPTVPAKTGYTGSWQQYTSAIHSNITIQAIYTAISTHTVTFVADLNTVKTMTVNDGYILRNSDYPAVPRKLGYVGSWNKYTAAIHDDITITAVYVRGIPSPTQPSGEIMSEEELEPWSVEDEAAAAYVEDSADETAALSEHEGQRLVSTQTVRHDYLTLNGKVVRETVWNNGTLTDVMDFIYDGSGRPFALNYSANGTDFVTYYYILNLQGDVVGLTDASGTFVAQYTYNAWGEVLTATGSMAGINPLRYRGYYYDFETGFYYLQSRYYDPANHRFINADGYTSTGQGFAGTNMFAYCGNNPVSRIDSTGQFWNEIWEFVQNVVLEVGNAIKEFIPQYVGCGALALLDGPVPVLDVFAIAGAAIITVGAIGYGVYRAIQTPAKSTLKAEEKAEEAVIPQETNNPVVFPVNPDYFNPLGLVKVYRAGTKNGSFISWMNPLTHSEVFRWDENPNYPNGPHYHIYGMGHYVPGMDIVPEPYASIYFPTR